ncbi:fungal pheromone STE3G-protein-coupled receptor, partial [Punctularia strigosozonata HHB-11173 SS5]|uniref:fungal pheromone STE3G-protein-coupled receptor n=1 Tax=Punctularia strigosozonata (strain HHB-11173) TaxID=741275 RepID=UPI0004416A91
RNVPAATMTSWLLVANIAQAVNTVIWSGKVNVIAPVWCDIVTPVVLATSIAVLGAILCVCARLELLSSSRRLPHSTNSKRIETVVRIIFCILLPLFYAALHLVVQDHRFVIIEDFGCQAA